MAEVKWIKISVNIFDDDKVKLIDSLPDHDAMLVIWIKLLTQAGKSNENGALYLSGAMPLSVENLATIFNRPLNTVRLAVDTFEKLGLVQIHGNLIMITNWAKHQNIDGLEKIREQSRNRNMRYRERLHLKTGDVNVTSHNAIDKELDKDKDNTIKNKGQIILTMEQQKLFDILLRCPAIKADESSKLPELLQDYPGVDHELEFKKFAEWWPGPKGRKRPWATLRNWLDNHNKFQFRLEKPNRSINGTDQVKRGAIPDYSKYIPSEN